MQLLSIDKVASMLGISRVSVFNLVKRGQLPAGIKIGKCRRWELSTIESFIRNKEAKNNA